MRRRTRLLPPQMGFQHKASMSSAFPSIVYIFYRMEAIVSVYIAAIVGKSRLLREELMTRGHFGWLGHVDNLFTDSWNMHHMAGCNQLILIALSGSPFPIRGRTRLAPKPCGCDPAYIHTLHILPPGSRLIRPDQ